MVSAGQEAFLVSPTPGELVPAFDPEAEKDRKRELARQRKRRQLDREKAEKTASDSPRESEPREADKFTLKAPFTKKAAEEVKLFTLKEAEEQLEKLVFIYSRGSELLDDVLEIAVKGHEKVQIWALSEDEATMLATLHMEKAKKDKGAARSARALVNLYDRWYLLMLVGPRVYATGHHIRNNGGLSFK